MVRISKERTFTYENLKKIKILYIANFFLILAIILPFFLYKRAAPQFAFYSELTAAICITIFLILASFSIRRFIVFNNVTIYLNVLAVYLFFDMYINSVIYHSLQWLYIGSLFLSSLVAIVITSLCYQQGYKKVFIIVCYGLMIGSILQDIVVILQIMHKEIFGGWIYYISPGQPYSGNIGQRNLLAHYLSWGILATTYLTYNSNIRKFWGWGLIIFQAAILGATNSKTLILYAFVIITLLCITHFWQKQLVKKLLKIFTITIFLILAFQIITLPLINSFQNNSHMSISSVARLTSNPDVATRSVEWMKAWFIFLNNPWFGTGWGSYAYQGFAISSNPIFPDILSGYSLASHTHNIILNLLAEVGIFGTIITIGGFAYILKPLLTKRWSAITLSALSMLVITGIHSLLEFPLWHFHFFLIFIILVSVLLDSVTVNQAQNKSKNVVLFRSVIISLSCMLLFFASNMYYLYWSMELYTYSHETDENDRIQTAKRILEVGNEQPLLKAYSDFKALKYIAGIPPDKIPYNFNRSLHNFAYFLPQHTQGVYYLITQCDVNGAWSKENWEYYYQLNHYYTKNLPTSSILLSMSSSCGMVYDKIYTECETHFREKGLKPICSVDESRNRVP